MDSRNFPSYSLRHAIRVWRERRYQRRNPLFYPPEQPSPPVPQPSSEDNVVQLPRGENPQRSDADA